MVRRVRWLVAPFAMIHRKVALAPEQKVRWLVALPAMIHRKVALVPEQKAHWPVAMMRQKVALVPEQRVAVQTAEESGECLLPGTEAIGSRRYKQ